MMSSLRSWSSLAGGDSSSRDTLMPIPPDVVKMGYLKKLKTMKKKFFVLRGDSAEASARLEYYDSEKKWKGNQSPKRSIIIKTCFNINKRSDTRQKYVIALFTKNDCFCLVLDTEEELEEWLKALLSLQHGEDMPDGELPRPIFENVWQVTVCKKELGISRNILGPYHLCLTDRTLSLVKMESSERPNTIEFSLQSIRRCGHFNTFFYMEVGQASVTGAGNLWMQTEDTNIATNMHDNIIRACSNCSKKDFGPKSRNRSSSANEASKPITVMQKWPTHAEDVVHSGHVENTSTVTSPASVMETSNHVHSGLTGGRERCDSLPTRPRTTSEGAHHLPHPPRTSNSLAPNSARPNSMYIRGISYSPPVASSPVSPPSGACSTDSASSSLSMDGDVMGENSWNTEVDGGRYGHSLTPDEPVILEENCDDYAPWPPGVDNNYIAMERSICLPIKSSQTLSNRKYSPNPSSSGCKSSTSPSQGSYMDMYSPSDGASPCETPGAYMPMSPGDSRTTLYGRVSSTNHSRGSSLVEEEGYVPMAPGDDGYVDMDHGHGGTQQFRHNHDHYRSGEMSPGGSSCSITSGTPSTDIRFSDYPLEKVSAFIKPVLDDITPTERPTRAYSVGSRPINNNNNTTSDVVNQPELQQRVRAFSVGSRCTKVRPILHPHLTPPTRHMLSSSHSSMEPSEDLMELDFTKNKSSRSRKNSALKKTAPLSSSERLTLPGSAASSAASSYSTAEGSYMEISPRASPKLLDSDIDRISQELSPPKSFRGSSYIGRSPPKTLSSYMDMRPSNLYTSSSPPVSGYPSPPLYRVPESDVNYAELPVIKGELHANSPPMNKTLSSSPKIFVGRPQSPAKDGYLEMKPAGDTKHVLPKSTQPRVETFPVTGGLKNQTFLRTSTPPIKQPLFSTQNLIRPKPSQGQDDYLDMNLKRKMSAVEDNNNSKIMVGRTAPLDTPKKVPEGYVQMSWSGKPTRKSSLDGYKESTDAYLNMSIGSSAQKRERRGSRRDRNRCSSQPITIQSSNKDDSVSTSPVFTFGGRKHSTGTPPKNPLYLPVSSYGVSSPSSSPFSSLGRNRARKTARKDSKDLNSGLTTPTGSTTTIFPFSLNSPGSPMKPFSQAVKDSQESSKCSVDASSGTVKISQSPEENVSSATNKCDKPENREYVNYDPSSSQDKTFDQEYTMMQPISVEPSKTISTPLVKESTRSVDMLTTGISSMTLSTPASVPLLNDTRPVDENNECTRLSEISGSEIASEVSSRNSEQLVVSRTPSVSSVGEKELHYASLDLVRSGSEGDDSGQSSRNLKSQSSLTESSSTSTPSPNVSTDTAFNYAEIDFTKCAVSKKKHH